ncbi:CDK5RAP3-like protein [Ditylenchus destructor]|uniref:CDK5RAP3-like protein n=1 Tax=Ditylenchus destructor TaxID=166010 RepID=A0AAD4QTP1_9BILA|nr:CDK5RAP3-like protein [Ditylenchus destructor]
MDNLPIDIHSNKLLDWLISRRHCKKDWQRAIEPIRAKVGEAIKDMPENDSIVALLKGSYINYFHCVEIVEILKETEKDSKNMFGFYSSQRMKDWKEIVSLYTKDNAYLAEAAQILQRLIQYDVPALRRQITKAENGETEAERKEQDYLKQSVDGRREYEKELTKLGIEGKNYRKELLQLAVDLPEFLKEIYKDVAGLNEAMDYYGKFRDYIRGKENEMSDQMLPLLRLLITRFPNDMTVYEWKYGHTPEKIEKPVLEDNEGSAQQAVDDEIDFGDDIDFGDEENVVVSLDQSGDIDVSDDKVIPQDSSNKVARGGEALTILESPETLPQVIAQLEELVCFLTFRKIDETSENMSDIYLSGIESRPSELAIKSTTLDKWIENVESILKRLKDPQKLHLFKIRSSPAFVDEIIRHLDQTKQIEQKYKRMAELAVEKQNSCRQQAENSREVLENMIESAKSLQENIESDISKRYNNREVYIMGEINAVLYG